MIELDVTSTEHLDGLAGKVSEHVDGLDGIAHSIGFAPQTAMGGNFMNTTWEDVATAVQVSAYSLKSLTSACMPLMKGGGSVVGLDFDATQAWPVYDWMGVAKAGLESTSRYLAKYLGPEGVRVNLVAAGPLRTMAAKSIPGFQEFDRRVAGEGPAGLGRRRPRAHREGLRGAAVGLVPRHHRRDRPRRRRSSRRRLTRRRGAGRSRPAPSRVSGGAGSRCSGGAPPPRR